MYFYVYHFARQKSQGKFERLQIVLYFAVKRDNWRTDFSQNSFLAGPALNLCCDRVFAARSSSCALVSLLHASRIAIMQVARYNSAKQRTRIGRVIVEHFDFNPIQPQNNPILTPF